MGKKTLVLGASENEHRYSNKAIKKLRNYNHPVLALGKREGKVADVFIENTVKEWQDIDTLTIYLNPANQKQYYDQILKWQPKRIIFNPGAENPTLEKLANENGITTENACTLVMLSNNIY
ncbi:MAG: CoA-binding protein [Chitinophagales bacterium]